MDVTVGEQTYIEGVGTVNVYQDEATGGLAGDAEFAVPQENINGSQWSKLNSGGVTFIADISTGRRPAIRVVDVRFPGSDYYQVQKSYEDGFQSVMGNVPGAIGPIPAVIIALILKMFIVALLVLAAYMISVALIKAATVNSVEKLETTDGSDLYRTCIGNLWGGTECYFYNDTKNTTTPVGGITGIGDVIKYGLIIGGVVAGAYVIFKLVIPAMQKKPQGGT